MCCDMAPSGEEIIFGSAEGYMHLWALTQEPCVSQLSRPLEQVPRLATPPATALSEGDSFALAAVYPSEQVSCLPSVRQIRLDCCLGASKAVWIQERFAGMGGKCDISRYMYMGMLCGGESLKFS